MNSEQERLQVTVERLKERSEHRQARRSVRKKIAAEQAERKHYRRGTPGYGTETDNDLHTDPNGKYNSQGELLSDTVSVSSTENEASDSSDAGESMTDYVMTILNQFKYGDFARLFDNQMWKTALLKLLEEDEIAEVHAGALYTALKQGNVLYVREVEGEIILDWEEAFDFFVKHLKERAHITEFVQCILIEVKMSIQSKTAVTPKSFAVLEKIMQPMRKQWSMYAKDETYTSVTKKLSKLAPVPKLKNLYRAFYKMGMRV